MQLTHLSHCVYGCEYHLVIVTKYRRKVFNDGIFAYFDKQLAEISRHYPLIKFIKVNHDVDHLHFLISIPPTMSVGKVIGIIKQNTAKNLKQKFPIIKETYWGSESVWSDGYFVTTVGADSNFIQKYIDNQGKKDLGQTLFEFESG